MLIETCEISAQQLGRVSVRLSRQWGSGQQAGRGGFQPGRQAGHRGRGCSLEGRCVLPRLLGGQASGAQVPAGSRQAGGERRQGRPASSRAIRQLPAMLACAHTAQCSPPLLLAFAPVILAVLYHSTPLSTAPLRPVAPPAQPCRRTAVEEEASARGCLQQGGGRGAQHFHDARQLLLLILPCK